MTTNTERQAAYKERMRKAGYQQMTPWVHHKRKEIRIGKKLRDKGVQHYKFVYDEDA